MIHAAPLNIVDLLTICRKLPQSERNLYYCMTGRAFEPDLVAIDTFRSAAVGWILEDPVKPVAAGGFFTVRPHVLSSWFYATDAAWAEHGREITGVVREKVKWALAPGYAHRIETVTLADRSRARNWYPKIGLQLESTLRGYGIHGEDAVQYVALRGAENV